MFQIRTVKPGYYVYGRRGAYIGRVEAANDECLRVREEAPGGRVFYVPRSALIGMLPGGELFLDRTRPELDTTGWQHPPHAEEPGLKH